MSSLKKLPLAIAFSCLGAMSSLSAIALAGDKEFRQEVTVEAGDSKQATIFVKTNGDAKTILIDKDDLHDPAALEQALADLPDVSRKAIVESLSNVHILEDGQDKKMIRITKEVADGEHMAWVTADGADANANVFVMELDSEDGDDIARKIMTKVHNEKIIEFKTEGGMSADMIMRLLKDAKLSPEDLDKLQAVLDAKR